MKGRGKEREVRERERYTDRKRIERLEKLYGVVKF